MVISNLNIKLIEDRLGFINKSIAKGSHKNNFAEFALRFRSDLAIPIEQNQRNSWLFRGFCE